MGECLEALRGLNAEVGGGHSGGREFPAAGVAGCIACGRHFSPRYYDVTPKGKCLV